MKVQTYLVEFDRGDHWEIMGRYDSFRIAGKMADLWRERENFTGKGRIREEYITDLEG